MAKVPQVSSKAGRNEGRKLVAALLNNIAAAFMLAAFLQPTLAALRQHQAFSRADVRDPFTV